MTKTVEQQLEETKQLLAISRRRVDILEAQLARAESMAAMWEATARAAGAIGGSVSPIESRVQPADNET